MKKIVSAFIAMVMVASTFATSVFAENTLNVSLTNNATGNAVECSGTCSSRSGGVEADTSVSGR